jgi:putative membrane protein
VVAAVAAGAAVVAVAVSRAEAAEAAVAVALPAPGKGKSVSTFTNEDIQRIEGAVSALEAKTSAEFVVAVVPASAHYSRGRAAVAIVWAVAAAIVFFRFVPWGGEMTALALELPVAWAVWALFGWTPLHRRLISAAEAERAVRANAFRIFAERGVYRTRDATGVLILVSELEHRAVILGDRGVHGVVGDAGWQAHVAHLVQRIREGKGADGVIEVLERLSALLERGVPRKADDTDELPNTVVRNV